MKDHVPGLPRGPRLLLVGCVCSVLALIIVVCFTPPVRKANNTFSYVYSQVPKTGRRGA